MNIVPAGDLQPSSLCPVCDYDAGIAQRCPECGSALPADQMGRAKVRFDARCERVVWLLVMIGAGLTGLTAWLSVQVVISINAVYSEQTRSRSVAVWEQVGAFAVTVPLIILVFVAWRLRRSVRKRRLRIYEQTNRTDSWLDVVGLLLVFATWAFPLLVFALVWEAMSNS